MRPGSVASEEGDDSRMTAQISMDELTQTMNFEKYLYHRAVAPASLTMGFRTPQEDTKQSETAKSVKGGDALFEASRRKCKLLFQGERRSNRSVRCVRDELFRRTGGKMIPHVQTSHKELNDTRVYIVSLNPKSCLSRNRTSSYWPGALFSEPQLDRYSPHTNEP